MKTTLVGLGILSLLTAILIGQGYLCTLFGPLVFLPQVIIFVLFVSHIIGSEFLE